MGKGRVVAGAFAVVAVLVVIAPPAVAASKTIDCGSSPGLALDQAGTYTIRTAVGSCGSDILIRITHSDVTLNLGGRMLLGNSAICLEGIHVDANLKRVAISNGGIARCDVGIKSESPGVSITKMATFDNGVGMDVNGDVLRGNFDAQSAGIGLDDVAGGTFIGNTVVSSGSVGIASNGMRLIRGNRVIAAGNRGIHGGSSGRIEGNTVYGSAVAGIFLAGGNVVGNRSIGNGLQGIDWSGTTKKRIEANRVTGNLDRGIFAEGAATVIDNVVSGNGFHGIDVASTSSASGNRSNGNLGRGIDANNNVTIKKNTTSGNADLGIRASSVLAGLGTNKAARNNALGTQCNLVGLCVNDPSAPSVGDARTFFLPLPCNTTLPITTPGTYLLGASVADCSGSGGISIESDNVTLDLKGHRIDGQNQPLTSAIHVDNNLTGVVVRNGIVSNFGFGIDAGDTDAVIENVLAVGNVFAGIAGGNGVRIRRNTVVRTSDANSAGIVLNTGATATGNTVVANKYQGIRIQSGPVTISRNDISGNGDAAIHAVAMNGNTITRNKIIGSGWVGIYVGSNNKITDNVIKGTVDYPIQGGNGNTIKRNKVTASSGPITSDENSVITDNVVRASLGGIEAGTGSTVARNRVIGTSEDGILAHGMVRIIDNVVIGNAGQGIDADLMSFGSGNVAKLNRLSPQCEPAGLGC